jgi:hypothetical protein
LTRPCESKKDLLAELLQGDFTHRHGIGNHLSHPFSFSCSAKEVMTMSEESFYSRERVLTPIRTDLKPRQLLFLDIMVKAAFIAVSGVKVLCAEWLAGLAFGWRAGGLKISSVVRFAVGWTGCWG